MDMSQTRFFLDSISFFPCIAVKSMPQTLFKLLSHLSVESLGTFLPSGAWGFSILVRQGVEGRVYKNFSQISQL